MHESRRIQSESSSGSLPDIDREPRFRVRVVASGRVTPDIFRLELERPQFFQFRSGQYVWLVLPGRSAHKGIIDRRAYSIASSPEMTNIELVIRMTESEYVQAVSHLKAGDLVDIIGPMGSAFVPPKEGSIMIAGGVGVTPFLSVLRSSLPGNFLLLLFIDENRPIHVLEELRHLAKEKPNIVLDIISGIPDEEKIRRFFPSGGDVRPICVSGPQGFVDAVDSILKRLGISKENARHEMVYPVKSQDVEVRGIFEAIDDSGRIVGGSAGESSIRSEYIEAQVQRKIRRGRMDFLLRTGFLVLIMVFSFILTGIEYLVQGESLWVGLLFNIASIVVFLMHLSGTQVKQLSVALMFSLFLFSRLDPHLAELSRTWCVVFPVVAIVFVSSRSSLIWSFFFVGLFEIVNLASRVNIKLSLWDTPALGDAEQYLIVTLLLLFVTQVFSRRQEIYEQYLERDIHEKELLMESRVRVNRLNELFTQISEQTSNHVVFTDRNGHILYANHAAERLTGYTFREMRGQTPRLWGGLMGDAVSKALWRGDTKEGDTAREILNRRRNGELYIALGHVTPITRDGEVIAYVATEEDITTLKQVDKAKTEFVSLASHQLRTPLSAVNWYSEMLLAGDAGTLNSEQKQYIDEIYASNHRMVDLVNALLNVSRIDLGTFIVEPEMVDVVDISRNVIKEMHCDIEKKRLDVKEDYQENLPRMRMDPKLLRMVLQNLVSNAVKYTPDNGSISMGIFLRKRGEIMGGRGLLVDSLCFSVSDTGYGIPESQKPNIFTKNIFTKLFRADNVREKDTTGTGLGLYIVRSIVNQSNGSVWFESEENHGTTFYVSIPIDGMKEKSGTKSLS